MAQRRAWGLNVGHWRGLGIAWKWVLGFKGARPTCGLNTRITCESMNEKNKRESCGAGKPGESTAEVGANAAGNGSEAAEANVLTSSEVARLLRGDLSETSGDPGAGKSEGRDPKSDGDEGEDPEAGKSEGGDPKSDGDEGEDPEAEKSEGGDPKAEGEELEAADGGEELPKRLQAELDAWEERGGGRLPEALQALVDKRIGKLTGDREEEKAGREKAEARVAELEALVKSKAAGAAPSGPMAYATEQELDTAQERAQGFVSDVENYLDDAASEAERVRVERYMERSGLDAKALKREMRNVNAFLTTQLPKEREALKQFRAMEAQAAPVAKQHFSFLEDKQSPEHQFANEVLAMMPDLRSRTPAHELVLGIWALGRREYEKLLAPAAKGNGKAVARVPIKTPTSGGTAPPARRAAPKEAQEADARNRFEAAPSRETVTELLKAGLRS